jgi:hypothetical protein
MQKSGGELSGGSVSDYFVSFSRMARCPSRTISPEMRASRSFLGRSGRRNPQKKPATQHFLSWPCQGCHLLGMSRMRSAIRLRSTPRTPPPTTQCPPAPRPSPGCSLFLFLRRSRKMLDARHFTHRRPTTGRLRVTDQIHFHA